MSTLTLHLESLENRDLLSAYFPTIYTTEHIDLNLKLDASGWSLTILNDDVSPKEHTNPATSLIYADHNAQMKRPDGDKWNFFGIDAGQPLWILPQNQNVKLPYLGLSASGTSPSQLSAWDPDGPGGLVSAKWIRASLMAVRGPGHFSVFDTDSFGNPRVWVNSADGITANDALYAVAGSHSHYNWTFTARGIYEVDVQAYTKLSDGSESQSGVVTYYFAIDPPPPTNSLPGKQETLINTPLTFSPVTSNAISFVYPGETDPPADMSVLLTVNHGTLSITEMAGVTITGNKSSSLSLVGRETKLNAILQSLMFTPPLDFLGDVTLKMTSSDRGEYHPLGTAQTDTDSLIISVVLPQPPINHVPGPQTIAEDSSLVFSTAHGNTISITDHDAGSHPLTITLTVTHGTLTLPTLTGLTGTGNGTSSLKYTGALTALNAALNGLVYQPHANYHGTDLLTIITDDLGSGTTFSQTDTDSVAITITPVNDPPAGGTQHFTIPVAPSAGFVVGFVAANDPDVGQTHTFTVSGGTDPAVFAVDPATGRITVADPNLLDFATHPVYTLIVDIDDGELTGTATIHITPLSPSILATGAVIRGRATVRVVAADGTLLTELHPFAGRTRGPLRLAVADVTGDGVLDVVVAGNHRVTVFDGSDWSEVASWMPFSRRYRGGVWIAAGDVNGDGQADVVVSSGMGGPHRVRLFDGADVLAAFGSGSPPSVAWEAAPLAHRHRGGASVALGDVNGDGFADVILASGPGREARVLVFAGSATGPASTPFDSWLVAPGSTRGLSVASGDTTGDGRAEVVVGSGPNVLIFDRQSVTPNEPVRVLQPVTTGRQPMAVTVIDRDGNGLSEVVTAPGSGVLGVVRFWPEIGDTPSEEWEPFPEFRGGIALG